ncbi:hypothetical protein E2C01_058758 [Portunus trituberculatus]|uniref:Uncharacterized protein n=1 Tax=Portunus trituberculatus TaxID=210409 RepID=A0A5B7GXB8_PORTR|nr:hypothetical protein [Portunus trituberculatus]
MEVSRALAGRWWRLDTTSDTRASHAVVEWLAGLPHVQAYFSTRQRPPSWWPGGGGGTWSGGNTFRKKPRFSPPSLIHPSTTTTTATISSPSLAPAFPVVPPSLARSQTRAPAGRAPPSWSCRCLVRLVTSTPVALASAGVFGALL